MKKKFVLLVVVLAIGIPYNIGWGYTISKIKSILKTVPQDPVDTLDMSNYSEDGAARIQLALVLDVSNSMDGLIDQAKAQLWMMVNELGKAKKFQQTPSIELSLYTYGHDQYPAFNGYVKLHNALSRDLDLVSASLFNLNTNGGQEYCGFAIDKALNELSWSAYGEDLKIIVIAGNESFYQGPKHARDAIALANRKGIIINTIFCGNVHQGKQLGWEEAASSTRGMYMNIDHNMEVAQIPTPYDDEIFKLNEALNDTYIFYGQHSKREQELMVSQDSNSKKSGFAALRGRAFAKSSSYSERNFDLITLSEESFDDKIQSLSEDELPAAFENKTTAEQKIIFAEKKEARTKIQESLKELQIKAESYEAKERAKLDEMETLDVKMKKAIEKLLKEHNFQTN